MWETQCGRRQATDRGKNGIAVCRMVGFATLVGVPRNHTSAVNLSRRVLDVNPRFSIHTRAKGNLLFT